MPKHFCIAVFLFMGATIALNASTKSPQPKSYVQGTVLSVDREEVGTPTTGGTNPADAPLQSQYYAYNVSVRVDCGTYVGRYETPFDYLPSAFAPNHPIDVHLTRHVMYFNLPNEREMKMYIVQRKIDKSAPCNDSTNKH